MLRRRFAAILCLAPLAMATAGCGNQGGGAGSATTLSATTFVTGSSTHTLSFDGVQREYIVYRPADLPSTPAPLVVMLHGGFGTDAQAEKDYGWDTEAEANHFVVAYPNGIDRAWNAGGGCCGIPAKSNVDDAGFIVQVVSTIQGEMPIDPNQIYATGMSNGALMDYRLACTTNVFAAIGPVSGTLQGTCPNPEKLSVLHIHGSADTHVPYDGGVGSGPGHVNGMPVPSLNAMWRQVDGCNPPSSSSSGVVTNSVAKCPNGRSVELITIAGAGHQWPGSPNKPLIQRLLHTDPPSTALDATQTIWEFFAAHPKQF